MISSHISTHCPPGHHMSQKSTSTRKQSDHVLGSSAGMTGSRTWKHETCPNRMTQRIRKSRYGQSLKTREADRHKQNQIGSMKNIRRKTPDESWRVSSPRKPLPAQTWNAMTKCVFILFSINKCVPFTQTNI